MGLFGSIGNIIGGIYDIGHQTKATFPNVPSYYTDPNFSGTQDFFKQYSENLLKGEIPDFYKPIGETVQPGTMNDYISESSKDLINQALGISATTGRGGQLGSETMSALGNMSATLRFEDYLRAMQGKEWLMNAGMTGEDSVRNAAAWNQNQNNAFNQWGFGANLNNELTRVGIANNIRNNVTGDIRGIGAGMDGVTTAAFPALSSFLGGGGFDLGSQVAGFGGGTPAAVNSRFTTQSGYVPTDINVLKAQTKNSDGSDILQLAMKLLGSGAMTGL